MANNLSSWRTIWLITCSPVILAQRYPTLSPFAAMNNWLGNYPLLGRLYFSNQPPLYPYILLYGNRILVSDGALNIAHRFLPKNCPLSLPIAMAAALIFPTFRTLPILISPISSVTISPSSSNECSVPTISGEQCRLDPTSMTRPLTAFQPTGGHGTTQHLACMRYYYKKTRPRAFLAFTGSRLRPRLTNLLTGSRDPRLWNDTLMACSIPIFSNNRHRRLDPAYPRRRGLFLTRGMLCTTLFFRTVSSTESVTVFTSSTASSSFAVMSAHLLVLCFTILAYH